MDVVESWQVNMKSRTNALLAIQKLLLLIENIATEVGKQQIETKATAAARKKIEPHSSTTTELP